MTILQVAVSALLLALLCAGMKESGMKAGGLVLFATGILILVPVLDRLSAITATLTDIAALNARPEMTAAMLKVLGVGYLVHISAECCRENGAPALASRVELCGKLEILVICLPYIRELLLYATMLAGG